MLGLHKGKEKAKEEITNLEDRTRELSCKSTASHKDREKKKHLTKKS